MKISHEIYCKHWKSLLAGVHCKKDNRNLSDPIPQQYLSSWHVTVDFTD